MAKARELKLQESFAASRTALIAAIGDKWPAFVEWVRKAGITVAYDPSEDILFVYPSPAPRPASTEQLTENIYVRLDRDTLDVVGMEVLGFQEGMKYSKLAALAFQDLLPDIVKGGTLVLPPDGRAHSTARRIADLFKSAA